MDLLNSSGPNSRGRGRGRGRKDMTPGERVANWVNEREARRLNKERWSGRSGNNSRAQSDMTDAGEASLNSAPDATEQEISGDRSKQKKHGVALYVPPSLRRKNVSTSESPSCAESPDNSSSSAQQTSCHADSHLPQASSDAAVSRLSGMEQPVESVDDCKQRARSDKIENSGDAQPASVKQRGRGRGKKKPEMEIYVPRALREAKRTPKPGKPSSWESNSLKVEQHITGQFSTPEEVVDNTVCEDSNTSLPADPFTMVADNRDDAPESCLQIPDTGPGDKCDESGVDSCNTSVDSCGDSSSSKKWKQDTESEGNSEMVQGVPSSSLSVDTTSNLTFEFYDPAVIAFMPSPVRVEEPFDYGSAACASVTDDSAVFSSRSVETHVEPNPKETVCEVEVKEKLLLEESKVPMETDLVCISNPTQSFPDSDGTENISTGAGNVGQAVVESEVTKDSASTSEGNIDGNVSHVSVPESVGGTDCELTRTGTSQICAGHESNQTPSEPISNSPVPISDNQAIESAPSNPSPVHPPRTETSPEQGKSSPETRPRSPEGDKSDQDDDEDSWDTLFDDNGDCVDESAVKELTEFVGKVEIDKPKINYLKYQPKEPELDCDAYSHILEIYDFPPELATCDLIGAFSEFSARGFDVKWVDDTRALGVFSSAVAAKEALQMMHPLLKVRPMSQASKKGQSKAKHCQEFLQPYKARPETTSLAARRLVAGALGMAPRVSKEVRDKERQKLKEAKEKRRQERQQKNDIWDGSFGKCAMDD
ncbi:coiled-coil domain-containing protein R3HCC1L [Aplysia californica]|uniref:Coiled-coil domain-containing protein R3HCC1L n=1 Tax=Aplysia californica TaxID=6500 RepID=A0ABM0JEE1_APLCA|nr:coiled-coil domain-containing protein R3HCC1L [Aplysia californica]XP_005091804.1 coiled-coil domain-containing protein R3HCC1L [Aplysia californica]XP_012946855.1 coiled-coil domain-containing protein R3HCC1L [Aplysia californica]XP_012946856.1 coiled-coil domain-containing protein R3HCC1L [Aplysia californica]XP_035829765.1 coiled-coil domain-containing protein R3HCC1L [Aplysia californica]